MITIIKKFNRSSRADDLGFDDDMRYSGCRRIRIASRCRFKEYLSACSPEKRRGAFQIACHVF
jgi:hypothetical protein